MKVMFLCAVLLLSATVSASECEGDVQLYDQCVADGKMEECEQGLLKSYTGEAYRFVNWALRGQIDDPICEKMGRIIHSRIQLLPKLETTVYRGTGLLPEIRNMEKNDCFSDRSFLSTSLDQSVAEKFAKEGALFTIKITSGRLISNSSHYPEEREVLLPPGTWFKLDYKSISYSGYSVFVFQEVPEAKCSKKITIRPMRIVR